MSGAQTIPAGTQSGDVLIAKLRSFYQPDTDLTPFNAPVGWTQLANALQRTGGGGDTPGSGFGYASYWKVAAASEPNPTFTAPLGEQIIGGLWAVYSSHGSLLSVIHGGTAGSSTVPAYTTNVLHATDDASLMLHAFCGHGTAFPSYTGFVNARVHHADVTLHSDIPFSSGSLIPPNWTQLLDLMISLDSEAGPFPTGTRTAVSNLADQGGYGQANTYVRVVELTGPPAAASGWTNWIID